MAFFNGGMGLNMVGIEFNEQRFKYCLNLQSRLLELDNFKEIAKMSQFFEGDGLNTLIDILGSTDPIVHLKLIYWFSEGFDPRDVEAIVDYINRLVINLEWLICDMTHANLLQCGFKGIIISSERFSGPMNRSSNSRTLYVHNVQMNSTSATSKIVDTVSERENSIITNFRRSSVEVQSGVTTALYQLEIRSNYAKKDRAAFLKRKRSIVVALETPGIPKDKVKKQRRSPKMAKKSETPDIKTAEPKRSPRIKAVVKKENSKQQRNRNDKIKKQGSSPKLAEKPKTPDIKTAEPKRLPLIKAVVKKENSKRQRIREANREAKRLKMERNLLEVLDWARSFEGTFELSP